MKRTPVLQRMLRPLRTLGVGLVFLALVVLLMVWLAGGFREKISGAAVQHQTPASYEGPVAAVRRVALPVNEEAVGSVRPVHEMVVTSRVSARITELRLTAGQRVQQDEVLVRLDDRDLQARVAQARATLDAAKASRNQAIVDRDRVAQAFANGAVAKAELDNAELAVKNADANVSRATELVNEALASLEYATIKAPTSGIVVDRRVNVGDTIMPGQVIATLYDPTQMQLVASARETLTQRLKVGESIGVRMDALGRTCPGTISEIVPEAETSSRTFQVKVTGPCPPGIYSGMFGRIIIPLDSEETLLIPQAAVRHVGQLELVDVVTGGTLERRIVRLGRLVDGDVEILSGLAQGEFIALPSASASMPATMQESAR